MIELLIGNIASGKSNYAKQRANEGWIVINDDAVVNLVHNGDYTLYQKGLKPLYKSIENHILYTAIAMGKDVVIDRGVDVRAASRQRWIAVACSLDVPICALEFERFEPEVHAQRRVKSDDRGHTYDYWLNVAQIFSSQYVAPLLSEGFVKIKQIKWVD